MNFEIAPKSTEINANWDEANIYCSELKIDGKTGWRLPTKAELNEIYESDNDFIHGDYYWSSTEANCDDAWNQLMDNGYQNYGDKNDSGYYVRAIRTIP